MKNLFLLATEKPSRLSILNNGELNFGAEFISSSNAKAKHIYITNSEEIKEGVNQWYLDKVLNKPYNSGGAQYLSKQNVIVLTTDKDLIEDGVQSIPDEFLEWFVKNSNCEEIEFEKFHGINTSIAEVNAISGDGSLNWQGKEDLRDYKIIIPKEELKQDNKWSESTRDITSDYFIAQSKAIQKCMHIDAEMAYNSLPKKEPIEEVGMYQQELFNYLHDLGAIALQSEMQEIERIVLKNSNINALNFEIDVLKRQIKVLKRHKDQIYNKIKELYNNQNITGFSKRAYAQCLDIVEQFKNKQ